MDFPSLHPQASNQRACKRRTRRRKNALNLPTEILLSITSYLPKCTWLSLRLVCRSLYTFSSNLPLITTLWFGPYPDDLSVFQNVCNHALLGSHVTTILYDVTRFEDLSIEELREYWPRPCRSRNGREHARESRKKWIEQHYGVWQYLKLVEEFKAGSFNRDEVSILTEGMKRLPNLKIVRLAFAFQKQCLTTDQERMSPSRRYSDAEFVTRTLIPWTAQRYLVDGIMVKNIMAAIERSGADVEELDLWQDYISVPLGAFNFEDKAVDYDLIFSRLNRLTIKFSHSSIESSSDLKCFQRLLGKAQRIQELRLSIDGRNAIEERRRLSLRLLLGDLIIAQFREMEWAEQPVRFGPTRLDFCEYKPPWPGLVWILERRPGSVSSSK